MQFISTTPASENVIAAQPEDHISTRKAADHITPNRTHKAIIRRRTSNGACMPRP